MNPLINPINQGYSISIVVESAIEKVFKAISEELTNWWGNMDKPVQNIGDIFTVSWGVPWYKFKVIEYKPNNRISWECIDSKQIINGLEGVEKEWVGTKIHWTIQLINPNQIKITFIHEGLIPEFICYELCSTTWDRFVTSKLKKYIEGD